jgi:hypothetical protein
VPTVAQTHRNLPVPLLKLRWTLRHARVVLTGGACGGGGGGERGGGQSVDVFLHGTHSLRLPPLPLLARAPPPGGSANSSGGFAGSGFGAAYDPGPFEWVSFPLDEHQPQHTALETDPPEGRAVSDSTAVGGAPPPWAAGPPRCVCGVACAVQRVDTMRGRQTLLTCAVTAAHKDAAAAALPAVQWHAAASGGGHLRSAALGAFAPNKRGCSLSVWVDEALSPEAA